MANTIILKKSSTASAVPGAGSLQPGELAVNLADAKLYTKTTGGTVILVGSGASGGGAGTVTSVDVSGGTTGLTTSGGPVTSSGTITLAGTLGVANGGTGATTLTSGYLVKGNGTSAVSASVVYDDGTNVGIGTASPASKLDIATGDLRFSGTGQRILGDFSNATFASRLAFQTSTVNGSSQLTVIPNGIGTVAGLKLESDSAVASGQFTGLDIISATEARITSGIRGAAAYVPMTFYTGGSERMRLDTSGNFGIGVTAPASKFEVAGAVRIKSANADTNGLNLSSDAGGIGYINAGYATVGQLVFQTQGTEAMRINASGNVGIGDAAPAYKLTVAGDLRLTGGGDVRLSSATGTTTSGGDSQLYNDANNMIFTTGTTTAERMRITSAGDVGINTTTPGSFAKLAIISSAFNSIYADAQGVANNAVFNKNNSSGAHIGFSYNGVANGSITTNGFAVSYKTSSDARLKENITDADDAANLIDAIQVRKFDWKGGGPHQRYGFIAQELLEVAPEAVGQPESPDEIMGVDYSKLVPMLVKEIQSLRARVAQLEGN